MVQVMRIPFALSICSTSVSRSPRAFIRALSSIFRSRAVFRASFIKTASGGPRMWSIMSEGMSFRTGGGASAFRGVECSIDQRSKLSIRLVGEERRGGEGRRIAEVVSWTYVTVGRRWKARDQSVKTRTFPNPLTSVHHPSGISFGESSLQVLVIFSMMIPSYHTLPHSEPTVWTSINQISALSEPFLNLKFPVQYVWLTFDVLQGVNGGNPLLMQCTVSVAMILHSDENSDGRTRTLDLHQNPSSTMRDGSEDLLKRIDCLILLSLMNIPGRLLIPVYVRM